MPREDVTQDKHHIRSYIDTARKHGADVITALRLARVVSARVVSATVAVASSTLG